MQTPDVEAKLLPVLLCEGGLAGGGGEESVMAGTDLQPLHVGGAPGPGAGGERFEGRARLHYQITHPGQDSDGLLPPVKMGRAE